MESPQTYQSIELIFKIKAYARCWPVGRGGDPVIANAAKLTTRLAIL